MMISEMDKARLQVGYKQTLRVLNENRADKVFVTEDSDMNMVSKVRELCEKQGVGVEKVATMRELGSMCGIDVGASCAVLLK